MFIYPCLCSNNLITLWSMSIPMPTAQRAQRILCFLNIISEANEQSPEDKRYTSGHLKHNVQQTDRKEMNERERETLTEKEALSDAF